MAKQHAPRFLEIVNDAKSRIQECTVDDARQMIENEPDIVLVDVREESEYANGHLVSAIHIGKGVIERDIEKLVPDCNKKIILYCGGGYRSALAADALQKMGYSDVISMDGGWRQWNESKYPIEQSQS